MIGRSRPARHDPVAQPQVAVGVEDELGDRRTPRRRRPWRTSTSASWSRLGDSGCWSGKAATPTVKCPALRTSATSSSAWSSPSGCGVHALPGPPGGSPRRARTLRTPASAYSPDDLAQLGHGGAHAGEVGQRRQRGLAGDPRGDADGAVAGRAAGAVGHRHERRAAAAPAAGSPATAPRSAASSLGGKNSKLTTCRSAASTSGIDARHVLGPAARVEGLCRWPCPQPRSTGRHVRPWVGNQPSGRHVDQPARPRRPARTRAERRRRRPRRAGAAVLAEVGDGARALLDAVVAACCAAASGCGRRSSTGGTAPAGGADSDAVVRGRDRDGVLPGRGPAPRRRHGRQRHPPRAARPRTARLAAAHAGRAGPATPTAFGIGGRRSSPATCAWPGPTSCSPTSGLPPADAGARAGRSSTRCAPS